MNVDRNGIEATAGDVAGVILAGGSSTRMGRDKADLLFEGETLLARTVRIVHSVIDHVIVVGPDYREAGIPGIPVIPDMRPGSGPLGAVVTGLNAIHEKAAFVGACDMPWLRPAAIRYLVSIALSSHADAVIPLVDGRAQTLHAIYRSSAEPRLRQCTRWEEKDQSLKHAVSHLNVLWVSEHGLRTVDPTLMSFRNVNTESDWLQIVGSNKEAF